MHSSVAFEIGGEMGPKYFVLSGVTIVFSVESIIFAPQF